MNIKQDGFYTYDEMIESIHKLEKEYPTLIKVSSIGTSLEGRDLPLLIISSKDTDHKEKPAYYIQANVHSCEGEGTTVSLYLANKLCSDPKHSKLLDEIAFYIVPRVNPDGAECAVVQKYSPRSREIIHYIKDHIIPTDVNDDGKILKMRIECENGNMKPYAEDPRLMVPRTREDTRGPFYNVYTEGLIHEWSGGEFYNPKKTVTDFNRNYPFHWPPKNQSSGKYPFSEPEIKAVGDFLLSKPNIFAGMDLHNGFNAIFRPGSLPNDQYDTCDKQLMDKIGNVCSKLTGFPYLLSGYRYETDTCVQGYGGIATEFVHFMLGFSFYTLELGNGFNQMGHNTVDLMMTKDYSKNKIKYTCDLLKYHDKKETEFFYPWTEYNHPQLGKVEIGGITMANAYGLSFPNDTVPPKAAECLIRHAMMCPRLSFTNMTKERLEGNLYKISGYLTNLSIMPANGMTASNGRPIKSPVKIQCPVLQGAKLVGGMGIDVVIEDLKPDEKCHLEWFVLSEENSVWTITAKHPRCITAKAIL